MIKRLRGFLLFVLVGVCIAQVDKGRITGTVLDPSGAVVPGVQVAVRNMQTGAAFAATNTNDQGLYEILNLPIGQYSIHFSKDGFKTLDRSDITISVGQVVKLNTTLQAGAVAETVTVSADASLLQTETSHVATTLDSAALTTLPLSIAGGRDISAFAFNTVPTVNGNNWATSVAGSQVMSKVVMIDGTDADAGLQGTQTPPGLDAVQQFQVETSGISAEAGETGGGAFMYELKSGTNALHGSAFGFDHNEAFDANTWSNDYFKSFCSNVANGSNPNCNQGQNYNRARNRFHDYGFSAGGPIWKNHTFIFGAYEKYGQTDLRENPTGMTVPTAQMLNGDFSQILDTSTQVTNTAGVPQFDIHGNPIYKGAVFNPSDPGAVFVGNIIPAGMISPQSAKIIALFKKDYQPINNGVTNNYSTLVNGTPINNNTHLDLKLDQNFSKNNHFNTSFNYYTTNSINCGDCNGPWQRGTSNGGPLSGSQSNRTITRSMRVTDSHTFSSSLLNVFSVSYNEWFKVDGHAANVDTSTLGFTNEIGTASNQMPILNFNSPPGIGVNEGVVSGRFNSYPFLFYQWHWKDTVSWVKGRHTFKFGGEWAAYSANDKGGSGLTSYTFSQSTGMPLSLVNDANASNLVGFGLANFELGQVNSANRTVGTGLIGGVHGRRKEMNFFVQDDIKVSPRLTMNASLRWDINLPYHEINGRWAEFNLNATNTTWAPILQQYGLSGLGAFNFLSSGSQSWEKTNNFHQFGPHIGAAYQISNKIVARGGYGLFFVPLGLNQWGALPYGLGGSGDFGYVGTDKSPVALNPSVAAFQWDQTIYPGAYIQPTRDPNANALDPWGQGSSYINPNRLNLGRTQNWNLGVEYELDKNTVLDFTYMGMHGSHLHESDLDPRNYPTWQQFQPLAAAGVDSNWITTQADASNASASCGCTIPWLSFLPAATNGYGGYTAGGSIAPFPQVSAVNPILFVDSPLGVSNYHALVAEVKKRGGDGLVADLSYTYSRATGNTVNNQPGNQNGGNMAEGWVNNSPFQDPYSYNSSRAIGTINPGDMPHQVKGYVVYGLPFGHGRRWLSRGTGWNYLAGGWNLGVQLSYHSGTPMAAINNGFGYGGWSALFANVDMSNGNLSNRFKRLDLANQNDPSNLYFNPAAFTNVARGTLGNQPVYYSNWRGWAYYDEDLSIVKNFAFGERFKFTLRGEFFNVLNRHQWSNPDTNINSPTFGSVLGVTGNRTGQVGARFEF